MLETGLSFSRPMSEPLLDLPFDYFGGVAEPLLREMKETEPELFDNAMTCLFVRPSGPRFTSAQVGIDLGAQGESLRGPSIRGVAFMDQVGKFFLERMDPKVKEACEKVARSEWGGKSGVALTYSTWDPLMGRMPESKDKPGKGQVTFVIRPEFYVAARVVA